MSYQVPEVRSGAPMQGGRDHSTDSPPPTLPRRRNLDQRRLFVGNLSYFCTKEELQDLFAPFGTIYGIQICKSRINDPLYYGFVHFTTIPAANAAIEGLHGQLFMGRRIKVHHDDVDDTSMTYGTRHNDKKQNHTPSSTGDGSQPTTDIPTVPSESFDAQDDGVNTSNVSNNPSVLQKKGTQVLLSFASDQNEVMVREDILYRMCMRFGSVIDCVVKAHSSSPNFQAHAHHIHNHREEVHSHDTRGHSNHTNHHHINIHDNPQSGYGFVIFEHEHDAQQFVYHLHPHLQPMATSTVPSNETTDATRQEGEQEDASSSSNATTATSIQVADDEHKDDRTFNDNTVTEAATETSDMVKTAKIPEKEEIPIVWLHDEGNTEIRIRFDARLASSSGDKSSRNKRHQPRHQKSGNGYNSGYNSSRSASSSPRASRYIPASNNNATNNNNSNGTLTQGYMQYSPNQEPNAHAFYYNNSNAGYLNNSHSHSNYSSRSTSPRLSAATATYANNNNLNSPPHPGNASSNANNMSPRTGSPRLSGMVMTMMHTPNNSTMHTTSSGSILYTTPLSSRSTSPRLSFTNSTNNASNGSMYVSPQQLMPYMQSQATPPQYYTTNNTASPYDPNVSMIPPPPPPLQVNPAYTIQPLNPSPAMVPMMNPHHHMPNLHMSMPMPMNNVYPAPGNNTNNNPSMPPAIPMNSHSTSVHVSPRMSPRASPPNVPPMSLTSHNNNVNTNNNPPGVMNLPPILAAAIPAELQGNVSLIHQQQHHHQHYSSHTHQHTHPATTAATAYVPATYPSSYTNNNTQMFHPVANNNNMNNNNNINNNNNNNNNNNHLQVQMQLQQQLQQAQPHTQQPYYISANASGASGMPMVVPPPLPTVFQPPPQPYMNSQNNNHYNSN